MPDLPRHPVALVDGCATAPPGSKLLRAFLNNGCVAYLGSSFSVAGMIPARYACELIIHFLDAYGADPKRVSNWVMNDVLRMVNERNINPEKLHLTPEYLADIIKLVDGGTINTSTGKSLIEKVEDSNQTPAEIVEAEGLAKVSDEDAIREIIVAVIESNPDQVATYKSGKTTIIGWFVGQVMKGSRGKADPQLTRSMLEELLAE